MHELRGICINFWASAVDDVWRWALMCLAGEQLVLLFVKGEDFELINVRTR